MNINYPFCISPNGRIALVTDSQYIKQLIEQILFTSPTERVNRPDFGSGTKQLVFAPNSGEVTAAYRFLVQGALQQWLGDMIRVTKVQINNEEMVMNITINYTVLQTQEQQVAAFTNAVGLDLTEGL
jgi:uncharacterized protein